MEIEARESGATIKLGIERIRDRVKRRRHLSDFDVLVKVCNIILMGRKYQVSPYFYLVMSIFYGAEFIECQIDLLLLLCQTKVKLVMSFIVIHLK
jgi:hypothetical protein